MGCDARWRGRNVSVGNGKRESRSGLRRTRTTAVRRTAEPGPEGAAGRKTAAAADRGTRCGEGRVEKQHQSGPSEFCVGMGDVPLLLLRRLTRRSARTETES